MLQNHKQFNSCHFALIKICGTPCDSYVNWKNPDFSNRINDADHYVQTKARISPTNNSFFINTFYEALSSE